MLAQTQTFSPQELRAMADMAEKLNATEVEVTDWRPDAPLLVLEFHPGNFLAYLDDMGDEVDVFDMSRFG